MRYCLEKALHYARTYLPALLAVGMFFIAGCMAAAAEQTTGPASIQLTWETLLTIYGPMAVWLIWFIRRDDLRRREDAEHRREWTELLQKNTEVLANVTATLSLTRADDEKHRAALYRLVEEVKEVAVVVNTVCEGMVRNTRVMTKAE